MRFPNWPVQRLHAEQPEQRNNPLVLYREQGRRGQRVAFCSASARRHGVEPGLTVAETKALLERRGAVIVEDDPVANLAALQQLAVRYRCYSPVVGVDELPDADSLLLDVTGCAHLFGGEETLARRVVAELRTRYDSVQLAIADTIGAAWAAAHFSTDRNAWVVIPADRHAEWLHRLPVESLRLEAQTVETLRELHLHRVGQLESLPRNTLPSRFGPDVLRRLDQAFGRIPESITPVVPAEPLTLRREIDPPLSDHRSVLFVVTQLLRRLLSELNKRAEGILRLQVDLFCLQAETVSLDFGTVRPSCAEAHWRELIALQLERTPLPGEVHRVQITLMASGGLEARQGEFFSLESSEADRRELAHLLDRLSNRLGRDRVVRPRLLPDAQPEFAVGSESLVTAGGSAALRPQPPQGFEGVSPGDDLSGTRPLHLERRPVPVEVWSVVPDGPPIQLIWQSKQYRLPRYWGPERIATGWWRTGYVQRDYYRAETDDGRHLWLFRNPQGKWFLHGVFE